MLKNKYVIVSMIALFVFVLVYTIDQYSQYRDNLKMFEMIGSIDHSGTENQVVEKLLFLLNETKDSPDSADNWGNLGMNLFIHNFKKESIFCFKKANTLNKSDFRWAYFHAVALDKLNHDYIIKWYELSKSLYPEYPPLLIRLGNRHLLQGELKLAAHSYNLVVNSKIKIPHAHLGLGKLAIEKGEMTEAKRQLLIALKMAPKYREAHALLAEVYRREGEKTKADEEFEIMRSLPERLDLDDPVYNQMVAEGVSSFWYQVRGNNYLNSGELNKAEREFKNALEAKPNEASHTSLGYVYQRQKRYEAAMDQYDKALKLKSQHIGALNNLAVVYYELGNIDKALKIIQNALEIDPESTDGYLNMGTFLRQKGNRKDAVKYFRRGMELAPGDMRFLYQLSWILATAPEKSVRDGIEALHLAEKICESTNFKHPGALDLLSVALAENGQFKKASETGQKAYLLAVKKKNKKLAEEISARQKMFEMQRAYREEPD
jgi:Tfp pilus assembly protein PilF